MRDAMLYYVYIIQTVAAPERFYVGSTDNVTRRLQEHNVGKNPHTSKFGPWKLKTYVAFSSKTQALLFERYLKTQSGRAFARKRL